MEKKNNIKTLGMSLEKQHKKDLGLDLPKDYFSKSKASILDKIKAEELQEAPQETAKVIPLYRRKIVVWSMSAVAVVLLAITVFNPFASTTEIDSNDVLIASLLTDESDVDNFVDDFVNDELLTEDVFSE